MVTHEKVRSLLDRAKAGDREAFGELCEEERAHLESFIRSRLGSRLHGKIEPEDLLQEAFLRAFQSISVFKGKDSKTFFNWVGSIAEHLIWNLSQKRSLAEVALVFDASGGSSPSRCLRRKERLERLETSLADLKPEQREAILLAKIDSLRVKEIAERMRRSESAVKQLLSRGLKELSRNFGDTESFHLPQGAFEAGGGDGPE